MKHLICILVGATLLAACEQKTETVAPANPTATPETTTTTTAPAGESPAPSQNPFSAPSTPSP